MNLLSRLNIGPRLALAFACMLALTATMMLVSLSRIGVLGASSDTLIKQDWVKAQAASTVDTFVRADARRTMELFFVRDGAEADKIHAFIASNKKKVDDSLAVLDRWVASETGKALVADVKQALAPYTTSLSRVDQLLQAKRREDASAELKEVTLPALDVLQNRVAALDALQKKRVDDAGLAVEGEVASARLWMLVLGTVALTLGVFLASILTVSITRPLSRALVVANAVASGDLTSEVLVDSADETGRLLAALGKMNENLVGIVSRVRNGADRIATGSAQIAVGNADLSQRTEEQAANLEQTAASMEELTATVKQNSDTAQKATRMASSASEAAAEGGRVVARVVATMDEIAASSRKIGDIVGTIDGIAFQTNILALNASVEAARAGEQGRGFAVVASEVRSLAQRSAQAAKQIKGLIGASVDKVEAGTQLVDDAGRSMADIVSQVRCVNDLIGEIGAASVEQTAGIGQVGDAVTELDRVTQKNAALVEESAAAAESLKHQAARLAETVAVFRTGARPVSMGAADHP